MDRGYVIDKVYRIATLTEPAEEIRSLLDDLPLGRVMDLLLMMRQSPRPVRNPAGFLRRAIQEGWEPGQTPKKVDRHKENIEEQFYIKRGLSPSQARREVAGNRGRSIFEKYGHQEEH